MFSVAQKRHIAEEIQKILRATNHPELPKGEIQFKLHVDGAASWSWADITNNGATPVPAVNPHNERQVNYMVHPNHWWKTDSDVGTEAFCEKCGAFITSAAAKQPCTGENK